MTFYDLQQAYAQILATTGAPEDEVQIKFDGLVRKHGPTAQLPLRDRLVKDLRIQSVSANTKTITLVQVNPQ